MIKQSSVTTASVVSTPEKLLLRIRTTIPEYSLGNTRESVQWPSACMGILGEIKKKLYTPNSVLQGKKEEGGKNSFHELTLLVPRHQPIYNIKYI